jgi:hypothetical protein
VVEAVVEEVADDVVHDVVDRLGPQRHRAREAPKGFGVAEGQHGRDDRAGLGGDPFGDDLADPVVTDRRLRAVLLDRGVRDDDDRVVPEGFFGLFPGHRRELRLACHVHSPSWK